VCVAVPPTNRQFAAKLPQNDLLIQSDGLSNISSGHQERRYGGDAGMRNLQRRAFALLATAMVASALAACGAVSEVGNVNLLPNVSNLSRPDWLTYSGGKNEFTLRPVSEADLVNADGQCAMVATGAATPEPGADPAAPQAAPLLSGGIALQMTECDVVRRVGQPEQAQIGTNERGERTVVLSYIRGSRPGVYRFTGGRLTVIERAPGAPAERPQKKKSKGKKAEPT